MPLAERDYMRRPPPGGGGGGGLMVGVPRPARVVKYLLAINAVVFIVQMFLDREAPGRRPGPMSLWLGVTVGGFWQLWRYVTFQFLHAGFWHILLNMLGLWLLGSPLEQRWGPRRFLAFYLSCGVTGGAAYVLIGAAGGLPADMPIIGASGGVYGLVLACAVLFPHFRLIFLFFPVPIRLAALIIFGGMALIVLQAIADGRTTDAMSDVAHLGGAVAAAVWIWVVPRLRIAGKLGPDGRGRGRWQKKLARRRREQEEIDRILDKIRRDGIDSLGRSDRRKLRQASRRQREEGPPPL